MIWTKEAHQSATFQTFECLRQMSPNLYFDGILLLNVYENQLERYRGVISHDAEVWYKIRRKINLLFQKSQEFDKLWLDHSKVSKIFTWIGPFCAKYVTFDVKKYRRFIFHNADKSCKICRKTDLWFRKWHEEFGKFSLWHLQVSKFRLWWDPIVKSRKCMS